MVMSFSFSFSGVLQQLGQALSWSRGDAAVAEAAGRPGPPGVLAIAPVARAFLAALGGDANLLHLEASGSLLRLSVAERRRVQERALRSLGAPAVLLCGCDVVEVAVGAEARLLAQVIGAVAEVPVTIRRDAGVPEQHAPAAPLALPDRSPVHPRTYLPARAARASRAGGFVAALGGPRNLQGIDACTTRLRLQLADVRLVRASELKALGALGVVQTAPGSLQVVLGPIADTVADEIRGVLRGAAA